MPVASWKRRADASACSRKCACPIPRHLLAAIPKLERRAAFAVAGDLRPAARSHTPDQGPASFFAALPIRRGALATGEKPGTHASGNAGASVCLFPSDRKCQPFVSRMMLQSSPADPLLKVEHLVVEYVVNGKTVHAVSDVSPRRRARRESSVLVGESPGCGKSTLGRAVLQLRRAAIRQGAV